jgi:hypothetical protein
MKKFKFHFPEVSLMKRCFEALLMTLVLCLGVIPLIADSDDDSELDSGSDAGTDSDADTDTDSDANGGTDARADVDRCTAAFREKDA